MQFCFILLHVGYMPQKRTFSSRPEDDILYQWRLKHKMEVAKAGYDTPAYETRKMVLEIKVYLFLITNGIYRLCLFK